jgi:ATP-binding cassette, subfamily A (ABC1), member 3
MSKHLLETRNKYKASRYGAASWLLVNKTGGQFGYAVHANYTGVHAAPVFANMINSAILRLYDPSASISTTLRQLPITANEKRQATGFDSFYVCVMILLATPFIPAAFALFIVRERELKAKHQQVR